MKVTVCELANDVVRFESDWKELVSHVKREKSELVLLPEMTFFPWPFTTPNFNEHVWKEAVESHSRWQSRLKSASPRSSDGDKTHRDFGKVQRGIHLVP